MKRNSIFNSKSKLTKVLFVVGICVLAVSIAGPLLVMRYLLPLTGNDFRVFFIPCILIIIASVLLIAGFVRHNNEIENETKIVRDNIFNSKSILTRVLFTSALVIYLAAISMYVAGAIYQTELSWVSNLLIIVSVGLIAVSSAMYTKERKKPTSTWVVIVSIIVTLGMFNMP